MVLQCAFAFCVCVHVCLFKAVLLIGLLSTVVWYMVIR